MSCFACTDYNQTRGLLVIRVEDVCVPEISRTFGVENVY